MQTGPCARAVCPMIYCPNSLPAIPSQGICCPRCVSRYPVLFFTNGNHSHRRSSFIASPSCNTSACPTYKCAAGIQPANLTGGECCDRCAPITKTTATARATQVSSSIKTRPSKESSSSSSSSSSESESSSSSDSSSDSDESHGKVSGNRRRLPCFIHKFKGKHDGKSSFHRTTVSSRTFRLENHSKAKKIVGSLSPP